MNLSVRDLEIVIALAEQSSFTRAAARCHLSPSAFSTRIATIEASLGARLFDRTTRSVEPTAAGLRLLESARRLHGDFIELFTDFRDHAARRKGRVAIAALPSTAAAWLPAVFARFAADYPGIRLTLYDEVSDACLGRLRDGSVDFAIASQPADDADLDVRLLSEDAFFLVCSREHPLARRRALRLPDVAAFPFIQLTSDSSVRQLLEKAFHPAQPQTLLQLEHLATVAGMVQAGLGVTVVPELTLFQFVRPGLVVRPLPDMTLTRTIHVIRRRDRSPSFAAAALYDRILAERGRMHEFLRRQLVAAGAVRRSLPPARDVRSARTIPTAHDVPPATRRSRRPAPSGG